MSVMQTVLAIALIVAVIAVVIGVYVFNHKNTEKIIDLSHEIIGLHDVNVANSAKKIEGMNLSGESLSTFNQWNDIYEGIKSSNIPEMETLLKAADEANNKYNLFKSRKMINQARDIMESSTSDFKDIKSVFRQLLQTNHDNAAQLASLLKDYQKTRKNVLSNSYLYGSAVDEMENRLAELENDFDEVKNLSNQGDHVEAKRILTRVNTKITSLNEVTPRIATGFNLLNKVFPGQLDELNDVNKQLEQAKYKFDQFDFKESMGDINKLIDESKGNLNKLDADNMEQNNQQISQKIDNVYDVFEKEMRAKVYVDKTSDSLVNYFTQASQQNTQLIKQLNHIDQSYTLNHGELIESNNLGSEINQLQKDYDRDIQQIADGQAIYSEIDEDYKRMTSRLEKITQRQEDISEETNKVYETEQIARNSLSNFEQEISLLKRKIDRRKLPGIEPRFMDFYNVVLKEILGLRDELNEIKINLDQISDRMILVRKDLDKLQLDANTMILQADLVERAMQYTNKYSDDEAIQKGRGAAITLYQQHEYGKSLDAIASALEKVEPGAFSRLQKEYQSTNN